MAYTVRFEGAITCRSPIAITPYDPLPKGGSKKSKPPKSAFRVMTVDGERLAISGANIKAILRHGAGRSLITALNEKITAEQYLMSALGGAKDGGDEGKIDLAKVEAARASHPMLSLHGSFGHGIAARMRVGHALAPADLSPGVQRIVRRCRARVANESALPNRDRAV